MSKIREKQNHRISIEWFLFFVMLVVVDIILIWKSHYGYGANDESFYLTISHRLSKGDALLVDEWHMSQMSAFITYPIMKLYTALVGTTEGILLHFRWIFIFVKNVVAFVGMALLSKKYKIGAVCAMAVYMLFTPYNLLQLCYNSMGLSCLLLAGILFVTIEKGTEKVACKGFFCGVFLALAVLCCPYLATLYLILAVLCLIWWKKVADKIYIRKLSYVTLGCVFMALVFMIFVLSRASISEIFANIPEMLKDPEHPIQSIKTSTINLCRSFYQFYPVATIIWLLEVALIVIENFVLHIRTSTKQFGHGFYYISIMALGAVVSLLQLAGNITFTYNLIMVPLVYLGIIIYLVAYFEKNRNVSKKPMVLGFFGLWYGFLLNMSSNNQLNIFSCASTIAVIATVLLLYEYLCKRDYGKIYEKCIGMCVFILAVSAQILIITFSVTHHAFWEDDISLLKTKIEEGPLEGIYTSEEHAKEYYNTIEDLSWFKDQEEGTFAFFSEKPYVYLYVDMPYGTHSGWSGKYATQKYMSDSYYKIHEDKIPVYVYVEKNLCEETEVYQMAEKNGYNVIQRNYGYILVKES